MSKPHDRLDRALAKHGVTACEYQSMICPHYSIHLPLEEMAGWTVRENEAGSGAGRLHFTKKEYLQTILGMMAKGWLKIQSRVAARQCARRQRGKVPCRQGEKIPAAGTVDFTRKGYLLHRRIMQDTHGERVRQAMESFCIVRKSRGEILIYSQSAEVCHEGIRRTQRVSDPVCNISDLVGGPAQIIGVVGPRRIGKWRPTRFLTLPRGYRATVKYKRLKRRRLDFAECGIRGWVERLQPVRAEGTIHGVPFNFGDYAGWTHPSCEDRFAVYRWHLEFGPGEEGGSPMKIEESPEWERKVPLTLIQALDVLKQCSERQLAMKAGAQG